MASKVLLPLALLAGAGIVTSQAGCDVNVHDGKASLHLFSAEAKDEWTHHYPLATGGRARNKLRAAASAKLRGVTGVALVDGRGDEPLTAALGGAGTWLN